MSAPLPTDREVHRYVQRLLQRPVELEEARRQIMMLHDIIASLKAIIDRREGGR